MVQKRHLTVLATSTSEDATLKRSPIRWLALGVLLVVALSLPLGMLGLWGARSLAAVVRWGAPCFVHAPSVVDIAGHIAAVLPLIASFALAAYISAMVVVRWGPLRRASAVALVGALGGALLASLAAVQGALRPWPIGAAAYVTLIAVGALSAAWANRFGRNSVKAANLTVASGNPVTRQHESH